MELFGRQGERCGIPHEFGSTGFGVAHAVAVAADVSGIELPRATVAIHGFGNVGQSAYKFLRQMGASIVALADKNGAVYAQGGLDQELVQRAVRSRAPIAGVLRASRIPPEEFWGLPVDVLVPASVTDVVHEGNKDRIKAKVVVEASNIPMREHIEDELFRRGLVIVPDFVANAGGVISSYAEYRGYNPKRMFAMVEKRIRGATRTVLERSRRTRTSPRTVALRLAAERVEKALRRRGRTFPG